MFTVNLFSINSLLLINISSLCKIWHTFCDVRWKSPTVVLKEECLDQQHQQPSELGRNAFSDPIPDLLKSKHLGWGSAICVWTSPPSGSGTSIWESLTGSDSACSLLLNVYKLLPKRNKNKKLETVHYEYVQEKPCRISQPVETSHPFIKGC